MPKLQIQQLSFQLDSGEWLFRDLSFSLSEKITALVGRNGVGKSVLFRLLTGELIATQGNVTCSAKLGYYSQTCTLRSKRLVAIADFIGIRCKLNAINAIENGSCDPHYYDLVGDDWDIRDKTQQQLKTLRISANVETLCHQLSGGQLTLLQLHKLFTSDAELLLLDEPSNHLDAIGREWLVEQMRQFGGQILLISHDRDLLRSVDHIYQLTSLGLTSYKGNYDFYLRQSTAQTQSLDRQIKQLQAKQKQIERQAQVNRERAQQREAQGNRARKSGSQTKLILDAMKDKAGQTKARASVNHHNQMERSQQKLASLKQSKEALKGQTIYLQQSGDSKRGALLSVGDYALTYLPDKVVSFAVFHGDRCHLKGANGCGKSALLRAIQGIHHDYSGAISRYDEVMYLDQHFGLLESADSMLESLRRSAVNLTESEARTLLAGIGFRRDSVYRQVIQLSGGEKMKLAMLIASHQPNLPLLLLDEPDNHLDIESKQLLAKALREYQAAFVLVSHDDDFVAEVGINKVVDIA